MWKLHSKRVGKMEELHSKRVGKIGSLLMEFLQTVLLEPLSFRSSPPVSSGEDQSSPPVSSGEDVLVHPSGCPSTRPRPLPPGAGAPAGRTDTPSCQQYEKSSELCYHNLTKLTNRKDMKTTLEMSVKDVKTTLETSVNDVKFTLETSGEDVKFTLETSVFFLFLSVVSLSLVLRAVRVQSSYSLGQGGRGGTNA